MKGPPGGGGGGTPPGPGGAGGGGGGPPIPGGGGAGGGGPPIKAGGGGGAGTAEFPEFNPGRDTPLLWRPVCGLDRGEIDFSLLNLPSTWSLWHEQ